jgi:hypothetical protein
MVDLYKKNFSAGDSDDRPIRAWNRTGDGPRVSRPLTRSNLQPMGFVIGSSSCYVAYEVRIDSVAIGA